jgi:steroid delta-isomerase-like uncharacterized protein
MVSPMKTLTEREALDMVNIANSRKVDQILEQYADDAVLEMPGEPKPFVGKEAIRAFEKENYTAFPDWTLNVKTVAVTGNEVLIVGTGSGTHEGPITGFDGQTIAPTHKKVVIEGMTHIVLNDGGKIKSFRVYGDSQAIREQLGIRTAPP